MPLALNKVTKKIRKKKNGKLDALGDRDVRRVNRASLRDQKLKKHTALKKAEKEPQLVRVGFFKVAIKDATEALSVDQVRDLIERWVHRDDHELERFIQERRPGRPALPKHLALQGRIETEIEEFVTGFYVPDLTDYKNMENLKRWDGSIGSLAQVKFTRITKDDIPDISEGEDKMDF